MAKKSTPTEVKQTKTTQLSNLHRWNGWLAVFHAFQGTLVLLLSATKTFPIQTNYLTPDIVSSEISGSGILSTVDRFLFDVNLAYLVAAFFFMSAAAHALVAFVARKRYEADLAKGINKVRWIEYSLSASTMMVAIGLITGIADISTLLMVFVLTMVMNLTGLAMEVYNQGKNRPNWTAFVIGCIAGITPWAVMAIYALGATIYGEGSVPGFVYWIYGSMFILFAGFAVNMYLQYAKVGKWQDYLYGERMYMVLSLVAKTVLAWQVFAGALRP